MSFLNPSIQQVLSFSSKDAGAPQINYAARAAGDIKAVIKACLVTGYGATPSAGWSIVNEAGGVAEFVSPSIEMANYRIGISDTTTTENQWYYTYKDVRTNPTNHTLKKDYYAINDSHADNGWRLIVTARGFYYVEVLFSTVLNALFTRVVFFGQVKSALSDVSEVNIGYWCTGLYISGSTAPTTLFKNNDTSFKFYRVGSFSNIWLDGANNSVISSDVPIFQPASVATDLMSAQYLFDGKTFIGEQVGMLSIIPNQKTGTHGVKQMDVDGRPMLFVCLGFMNGTAGFTNQYTRSMLIYLDYWEY